MLNKKLICILALALPALSYAANDVASMLKTVDTFRMGTQNMQVETLITTYLKDGSKDRERNYRVYAQDNRKSLVLMQSPAEKGQKVLMLDEDFWMLLPGSQRAMRITPMQKLLGEASVGDIATQRYSEDYDASVVGEEDCAGRPCVRLSMNAKRKSSAYQHIDLWLGKKLHEPIKADLYVQSEKLAKQARFVMDKNDKPTEVAELILIDQLGNGKATHVRYLSRKPKDVPEQWLNPMFLAKNPSLE